MAIIADGWRRAIRALGRHRSLYDTLGFLGNEELIDPLTLL